MTALEFDRYNVIGFNNNSVDTSIKLFLEIKAQKSKNTAKNYQKHIEEFLTYCIGKTANIKWEEILNIKYTDVLLFQKYLLNKGLSARSINAKMAAIKSLYKHLYKDNKDIDMTVVDVEPLDEGNTMESSWGSLTEEEIEALYKFCEQETYKPLTKRLFFETAIVTALRKDALLNITWDDIKRKKDKSGIEVWTICVRDKGGKYDLNPITDEFYNRLCQLKAERTVDDNRVFQINEKTLVKTLKDFCKVHGIDESRNICLHSLKKASMDMVYNTTKDIVTTAMHGHHKGFEMAYRTYLNRNYKLTTKPSYTLLSKKVTIDDLKDFSKEQLLEAIEKCGQSVIKQILTQLGR